MYTYVANDPLSYTDPNGRQAANIIGIHRDDHERQGAIKDFRRNYLDMRNDDTIGNDKFFHCKANCEAAQRGPHGKVTAKTLSYIREVYGQVKKEPVEDMIADMAANQTGRDAGASNS